MVLSLAFLRFWSLVWKESDFSELLPFISVLVPSRLLVCSRERSPKAFSGTLLSFSEEFDARLWLWEEERLRFFLMADGRRPLSSGDL